MRGSPDWAFGLYGLGKAAPGATFPTLYALGVKPTFGGIWIGREALDPEIVALAERILERNPALKFRVPTVCTAHIGAQVGKAFLRW
jgi:hypothetical protein